MEHEGAIVRRGLSKKHASVEYEIWQWKKNIEESKVSYRVTKSEIQCFALEAFKKAGITNFKASHGWYRRWRLRWENRSSKLIGRSLDVKADVEGFSQAKHEDDAKEISNKRKLSIDNNFEKLKNIANEEKKCKSSTTNRPTSNRNQPKSDKILSLYQTNLKLNNRKQKFKNENKLESSNELSKHEFTKTLGLCRKINECKHSQTTKHEENAVLNNEIQEKTPCLLDLAICKPISNTIKSDFDQVKDLVVIKSCVLDESLTKSDKNPSPNKGIRDEASQYLCYQSALKRKVISEKLTKNLIMSQTETRHQKVPALTFTIAEVAAPNSVSGVFNTKHPKSMFDQNYLDFGDHELYCDSCEDFHPDSKGLNLHFYNQDKSTQDFLLSCVSEKTSNAIATNNVLPSSKLFNQQNENQPDDIGLSVAIKMKNPNILLTKGRRYQLQFKTKVINYALSHSLKEASSMFNVNRSTVSEWVAERKRALNPGPLEPLKLEMEKQLEETKFLTWLESSKFNLTNDLLKEESVGWLQSDNYKNCPWIHMYAHRLHGTKHSFTKKRYIAYPDAFKRVVVFYAETHSILAASRVFNVARRRVFAWQELLGKSKKLTADEAAHNVTDITVDKQVFEWYCSQHPPPSSKKVREKGVELYRLAGYATIQCCAQWYYRWRARHKLPPSRTLRHSDPALLAWVLTQLDNNQRVTHTSLAAQAELFNKAKVSKGWVARFCKRHHKLLMTLPEPATTLPRAMELQVHDYRKLLQDTLLKNCFEAKNIIAMDEIPLQLLPQDSNRKSLLIRRPGFESCQASLMISCSSDGTFLPAMFVFKGCLPTTMQTSPHVISAVNATGLVTEEVMVQWMNNICVKQVDETGSVLITDCFGVHTSSEVQRTMATHKIHHAVIPGGCAFKLLPTIQVCHIFKSMLEGMCLTTLASQTSVLRPPSPDQLYEWAAYVHNHLANSQKEKIKAAFNELLFKSP